MIHRLVTIPLLPHAFQKEIDIIQHIAESNEIKIDIPKLVRKKLIVRALDSTTTLPRQTEKKRWIRIPYLGTLSHRLSRILRQSNLNPAFYTLLNLKHIFSHLKDPIHLRDKSGVYKLECEDCPATYIGQSGRKMRIRIAEHTNAVRKNRPTESAFAAHLLETGHSFDELTGVSLLHCENKGRRLTALENIEITKAKYDASITLVNDVIPYDDVAESLYTSSTREITGSG